MRLATMIATSLFLGISISSSQAVSLSEVIRKCGDDGKAFCKGVGYGKPMQDCLVANKPKLSAKCTPIIERLQKGEKVGIFG